MQKLPDKLYENYALGTIEPDRYAQLSQKYSEEYYLLKKEQDEITARLSEQEYQQMWEEIEKAKHENQLAYHRAYNKAYRAKHLEERRHSTRTGRRVTDL